MKLLINRARIIALLVAGITVSALAAGCREQSSRAKPTDEVGAAGPSSATTERTWDKEGDEDDRGADKARARRDRPRKAGARRDRPRNREDRRQDSTEDALRELTNLGYVDFAEEAADEGQIGVVVHDKERSYPGYNLVTVVKPRRAELIDTEGNLVHYWTHGETGQWERAVLLPDGDLLVVSFTNPHFLLRLNWNNEVIWQRDGMWHHDVTVTPDGTIAGLKWEYRKLSEIDPDVNVMDNFISRFDPASQAEERRSLYDVLASRPDMFTFEKGRHREGTPGRDERIDLLHVNSLRWVEVPNPPTDSPIYGADNVIVSIRYQDTAAIFNWKTSELLWTWGKGEVVGPHDAQVLANGNVLVFDNGSQETRRSRVVEVNPLTKEVVWMYEAPNPRDFYSRSRGGNQRLPNGNTLITESENGSAFEVTPEGEVVWKYFTTHRIDRNGKDHIAAINRCYRYETEVVDKILKRFEGTTQP